MTRVKPTSAIGRKTLLAMLQSGASILSTPGKPPVLRNPDGVVVLSVSRQVVLSLHGAGFLDRDRLPVAGVTTYTLTERGRAEALGRTHSDSDVDLFRPPTRDEVRAQKVPQDGVVCVLCGEGVKANGLARASHGRSHVRRGEAREERVKGAIRFFRATRETIEKHDASRDARTLLSHAVEAEQAASERVLKLARNPHADDRLLHEAIADLRVCVAQRTQAAHQVEAAGTRRTP